MPLGQTDSLLSGLGGGEGEDTSLRQQRGEAAVDPREKVIFDIQREVDKIWRAFKAGKKYQGKKLTNVTALEEMTKLRQELMTAAGLVPRSEGGTL